MNSKTGQTGSSINAILENAFHLVSFERRMERRHISMGLNDIHRQISLFKEKG
jgi:hypothetical protein